MSTPIGSIVKRETQPVSDSDNTTEQASEADLFHRHSAAATRYAMSIVRRWDDAEEIVQEAFCKLIAGENHRHVVSRTATKAFLFTTVRNMSIDKLRQQSRRRFEPVDTEQIANRRTVTDEHHLRRLETRIESAMRELPETWADALQLKVNGGLSYAEIAEVLSATHNQIRTWIYRARKQLQNELDEFELSGGATS